MNAPLLAQWQRLIFPPEGTAIRAGEQLKTGNRYPDCSHPDWQAHQGGKRTYAVNPVYPGPDGDLCKWGVLDIDEGGDSLAKARALLALCDVAGLPTRAGIDRRERFFQILEKGATHTRRDRPDSEKNRIIRYLGYPHAPG